MVTNVDAFPLLWPVGYKKTVNRIQSRFKQTMDGSQRALRDEIKRLGGTHLIVSSNIPVRQDGGLYTVYMDRKIDDPGVAVYFKYKGKDIAMCCDKYTRVWENVFALAQSIDAIRSMERWGVSDFIERAFTGFAALPESQSDERFYHKQYTCWEILQIPYGSSHGEIRKAYRMLVKTVHPDVNESPDAEKEFDILTKAYNQALSTLL